MSLPTEKATARAICVALSPVAGLRKVQSFRLEASSAKAVLFALIYLPDGIDVPNATLHFSTATAALSLYQPE
jgi:hypothetical protein